MTAQPEQSSLTNNRKSGGRRGMILVTAMVFFAGALVAVVGTVLTLIQPVTEVSSDFLHALRRDDYAEAYRLLSFELQAEIENPQAFEALVQSQNINPSTWNVNFRGLRGDEGEVGGTLTLDNGQTQPLSITLRRQQGAWHIAHVNVLKLTGED